jgi:cobalamin biosynthetic protein CobC
MRDPLGNRRPDQLSLPEHGGRVARAARQWGIPEDQWLDLSTGINPVSWPVPAIPASVWQRLPEDDDDLPSAIRHWSGAPAAASCLPVPGSQAAIQLLPQLYPRGRVGIPVPGYREHGYWWRRAGHETVPVALDRVQRDDRWLDSVDVLVWINPNNPTGLAIPAGHLRQWHQRLQSRGGTLVVDEAFVAPGGNQSLAPFTGTAGLVVLRSLGKFFGLAGVRAGAVLGSDEVISALAHRLGPWAMSGPARYVMQRALGDESWQRRADVRLRESAHRLHQLLLTHGLGESSGTELFRYLAHPNAAGIHQALARQAVLVRRFEAPSAIRVGLPGDEAQWRRLDAALAKCH